MVRVSIGAAAFLVLAAAACSKASDESSAKRSPTAPPPPAVEIPADLHIPVEVDGQPAEPINKARLSAAKPDFSDGDRSAWKLTQLLGAPFARKGAVVEALSSNGVSVALAHPASDKAPQPVLFLTRRGEVVVALVDPANPFPKYHGQGGRLRRPGDPRPRLSGVSALHVRVESADAQSQWQAMEQAGKQTLAGLEIDVDGKPLRLTAKQLATIPTMNIRGDQGDRRVVWSMRDVVAVVAAPSAHPTEVVGEDGAAPIDLAAWNDAAQTPILRVNRRGMIKLQWIGQGGKVEDGGEVRGVRVLHVVTK